MVDNTAFKKKKPRVFHSQCETFPKISARYLRKYKEEYGYQSDETFD